MFKIEGTEFRLFWDMDRPKLAHLSFSGRAEWLQLRTVETLLKPLDVLKKAEGEALVWLAGTELIEIVPGLVESSGSRRTARYATWTC